MANSIAGMLAAGLLGVWIGTLAQTATESQDEILLGNLLDDALETIDAQRQVLRSHGETMALQGEALEVIALKLRLCRGQGI